MNDNLPATSAAKRRLAWVELGRGGAALAVVAYHASLMMKEQQYSGRPYCSSLFGWGFVGVDFFFVLSGFIILYVHYDDLGCANSWRRYAWRRLARIFPTYWLILAIALIGNLLLQSDKAPLSWNWLASQLLILPNTPWLGPAWTLRFELLFYAIFASLIFSRTLGMVVLATWLLAILTLATGVLSSQKMDGIAAATSLLSDVYNLNFFMGMSLAWVVRTQGKVGIIAGVFAVLGLAMLVGQDLTEPLNRDWAVGGCGLLSAGVLGGLLMINQRFPSLPAVFVWLGAISYSLYLCHVMCIGYVLAILARIGLYQRLPESLVFVTSIVASLAMAGMVHRWFEKPVLKWAHQWSLAKR